MVNLLFDNLMCLKLSDNYDARARAFFYYAFFNVNTLQLSKFGSADTSTNASTPFSSPIAFLRYSGMVNLPRLSIKTVCLGNLANLFGISPTLPHIGYGRLSFKSFGGSLLWFFSGRGGIFWVLYGIWFLILVVCSCSLRLFEGSSDISGGLPIFHGVFRYFQGIEHFRCRNWHSY